jgi:DNA-directed RNA polymerase subunit alpha
VSRPAAVPAPAAPAPAEAGDEAQKKLAMPISALDLSVRASNCLEAEGIQTVGDLVARTEDDLLKLKNFGRTTFKEVEKKLQSLGLSFRAKAAEVGGQKG